jgi:hypothetical protein
MAYPNVVRLGIGWKERRTVLRPQLSIKVYVKEKRKITPRQGAVPRHAYLLVPIGKDRYRRIKVPTDVVWHAPPKLCVQPGSLLNPVLGGAMIAAVAGEIGTFGGMVVDNAGRSFALTAGHVVRAVPGPVQTAVVIAQPPPSIPVPPGMSALWGRTAGGAFGNTSQGFVDFALIRLTTRPGVSQTLDGRTAAGATLPLSSINTRIAVTKFGAISERTFGTFAGILPSVPVQGLSATRVIEILGQPGRPFGVEGDSGALIISMDPPTAGSVVGILFATAPPDSGAPGGRGFVVPFERLGAIRLI